MSSETLIRVEHLWRYYGALCAVHNVSFEVRRGEVLGFLGPNGAGKSSTMQIISGNLAPSAGRVWIAGYDILDQPRLAKAALGFLPEQPPLYRELSVDEYLSFCAQLHRIPRRRRRAALHTAKERCGLAEVGRRLIGNLSKGYQQRVGIAQAIIHSPAVVILDEPTVGLDPIQIREIRGLIRELRNEHSVILSTHILPEVQATCDRVQIIHQGRLVLSDSIEGLMRRMDAASLYLGLRNPPMLETLRAVPGVIAVETLEDGRLRVHHPPQQNPAETLVNMSVQHGWGLYELTPERLSLEQIFVDITQQEAAA
ncbi:MAG TPA: ATP-binding cassette domain-containing protein [Gammaproteobacteria bacterium]|nr:ATP-binding cassette domain-containing protein [Gammaproteobacteria bacterium]